MPPLEFEGRPVVLLDDENNFDCPAGLSFSEHPIDGVINLVRRVNPDVDDAESISSRIHYSIQEYLLAALVIQVRRRRNLSVRTICRAPGSPLGVLRRMHDAVERRDFRSFEKNAALLTQDAQKALDQIVDDDMWDRGAHLIYPSLPSFRESCRRVGFVLATSFKLRDDQSTSVAHICLMLSMTISKLRTKGRRPCPERDLAAAEAVLQYFGFVVGNWTPPRQPSRVIGDSQRTGPLVEFIGEVERCYGINTPALCLIPRSSGAAWARINSIVAEKMGLSGAV